MLNMGIGERTSVFLDEFKSWLRSSIGGDGVVYALGELGKDRESLKVGNLAWNCQHLGICCLVQKANGARGGKPRVFEYIAYKTHTATKQAIEEAVEMFDKSGGKRIGMHEDGK